MNSLHPPPKSQKYIQLQRRARTQTETPLQWTQLSHQF